MKLSLLIGGAIGYVLGAKAGRERYEAIVRAARRFAGSQTIQTTAGVLQAQIDTVAHRAKALIASKVNSQSELSKANGYHH